MTHDPGRGQSQSDVVGWIILMYHLATLTDDAI